MNATAVTSHFGIRYATARRFEAPELVPYDPASTLGRAGSFAPQVPGMMEQMMGLDVSQMSEDCLFLNVFAPSDANETDRKSTRLNSSHT